MFVSGYYLSEGSVQVGVPQRPVLEPLLFSIYLNDIQLLLFSSAEVNCDMLADDSSLTAAGKRVSAVNTKLQTRLQGVCDWCSSNIRLLNPGEQI